MHTLSPHSEPANGTRTAPAALLQALAERFGAQCSTALAVRQQHGRDEGTMDAPPPAAVVFAESTRDVQDAVRVVSLGELTPEMVDMRTMVLVGSSTTCTFPRADGGQWVYTPRWYASKP